MLNKLRREVFVRTHPFWGFIDSDALAINKARMEHLATLDLPIAGKSVLEVGAGIGLLTGFFESRGCNVLSTDARPENVAETKRRYPARQVATLDLERPQDVVRIGKFDIVFCYGTLYHLAAPEPALEALGKVSDMILLETCLSPGDDEASPTVGEELTMNQAFSGVGSRPTRSWVLNRLTQFWGHGYISLTQPSHPDFPLDWTVPSSRPNTRAIFVGSRAALANPLLSADIPQRHRTA
jgi:SAM-dependent methyltransferase